MNQARSSTSPFYKQYRNPNHELHYDKYSNNYDPNFDDFESTFFNGLNSIIDSLSKPKDIITHELIDSTISIIDLYAASNENNWYRAELFKLYLQHGSIRKLSKQVGIPVMSICDSINEFKTDIKRLVNENTFNTSV